MSDAYLFCYKKLSRMMGIYSVAFLALFILLGCKADSELAVDSKNEPERKSTSSDNQAVEASKTDNPDPIVPDESSPPENQDFLPVADDSNAELPGLPRISEGNGSAAKELDAKHADRDQYEEPQVEIQTIEIPEQWKRLGKNHEIWIDLKEKQVIVGGRICMNAGPLEVFACNRGTKEHEAIVSANALSSQLHAGLLAIGVNPGHPVKWPMEEGESYVPAAGPIIEIDLIWKDESGQKIVRRSQELVLNTMTKKTMAVNWVFGGSETVHDEETGESYYLGDSGEMICLSNFSTATIDVPVESSDANEGLLFEANPEKIPAINTKVYLVLKPVVNEK